MQRVSAVTRVEVGSAGGRRRSRLAVPEQTVSLRSVKTRQTFTAPWLPAVSPVRMQELGRWWGGKAGEDRDELSEGKSVSKKK